MQDKWVVISSDILGEDIVYVSDAKDVEAAKGANPGLAVYQPDEQAAVEFLSNDPEEFKKLHKIKKFFGGLMRTKVQPSEEPKSIVQQEEGWW